MSYKKMNCWVVYGRYKDDEELPVGCEELCFIDYVAASRTADEWREDNNFEEVIIEEEEREIWIEDKV